MSVPEFVRLALCSNLLSLESREDFVQEAYLCRQRSELSKRFSQQMKFFKRILSIITGRCFDALRPKRAVNLASDAGVPGQLSLHGCYDTTDPIQNSVSK